MRYLKFGRHILNNLLGWRTKKKIVVIESDDWGSIRMPSKEVYNKILNSRYSEALNDPYMRYDCLESEKDLQNLFEVLCSVRDSNNRYPVITNNTIVANPNFEKISDSNYEIYHYESFTETLANYYGGNKVLNLWMEGVRLGLFFPQLHGREHINIFQWLNDLRKKDNALCYAFDQKMISLSLKQNNLPYHYMEAFDFYSVEEAHAKTPILLEAFDLFYNLFGYKSSSFIANCYVWSDDLEKTLSSVGVRFLQGIAFQKKPYLKEGKHHYRKIYHYTGQSNSWGQRYLVRNCFFEPSHRIYKDDVDECLGRIQTLFLMNRPAIISTHRLNFIGTLDENNSARSLVLFQKLLKSIVKYWPDVVFMTSVELGEHILNSQNDHK